MENEMTHLDYLMHPIFYVARQGGCDRIREVGDPKRFCDILGCVQEERYRKSNLHTLTESALYSPVDDPEVFVGFGFAALIIVSTAVASGKVLGKLPPQSRHGGDSDDFKFRRSTTVVKLSTGPDNADSAC
jgi:hypothetical protein